MFLPELDFTSTRSSHTTNVVFVDGNGFSSSGLNAHMNARDVESELFLEKANLSSFFSYFLSVFFCKLNSPMRCFSKRNGFGSK